MNTLSWLIYSAAVIPSIGALLAGLSIISLFATCIVFIVMAFIKLEQKEDYKNFTSHMRGIKKTIILSVSLLLFSTIFPDKQTLYLIAGSEAGEIAVTSEVGKEILSDIQLVIKNQIKDLKGSD